MKQSLLNRWVAISIVVLPLLIAGPAVLPQQNTNTPSNKEMRDLLKVPGKLVSEAKTTRPIGALKLTGYRVEEIQLPRSMTVDVRGKQTIVNKAWRVTVSGGPFPVRAQPAVVWVDDEVVGNGIENATLSQITAITFDSSLIREGGVVAISYGEDKGNGERIPQALQIQREGGNQ
jgi:hypothetical protein